MARLPEVSMRSALVSAAMLLLSACAAPRATEQASPAVPAAKPGVARVWHGRTPTARADEYATYLAAALPKFRTIPGNLGYEMFRETAGDETHFMVVSYWTEKAAIRAYAGDDISRTRHLPRDAEFLVQPEQTVRNYDLVVRELAR
jgi:heme-degrading monooxygenase HmoA